MKTLTLFTCICILAAMTCKSQNSEHRFSDTEIIKLVSQIKKLEAQNNIPHILLDFNKLYNTNEKKQVENSTSGRNASQGQTYTNDEVIKLANYVKELENRLNNTIIAEETYKTALVDAKK